MTKKSKETDKKREGVEFQLSALESKIQRIENQNLSLSDAMKEFQAGVELVSSAQAQLSSIEQTISMLSPKSEELEDDALGNE